VAIDVVGLSYDEAARALRIPSGTVTSRLFRARRQVAQELRSQEPDAITG
jgi:DNA-directed RNA polymerase specialized sigma24 family protein